MKITYDPHVPDERALVDDINALVDDQEAETIRVREAAEALEAVDGEPVGEAIGDETDEALLPPFLNNVGNGWEFIRLGAEHFGPNEEFGFAELSSQSGVPEETLKAYHRNLGRTATSLGHKIDEVIPSRWDGSRVLYRIPPALHAEATT